MDIALMLEGQNGLNWPRWKQIAQATERLGFVGLYRSDHYTNASPPDRDSLELWVSLTWLASHTEHIEFGPMVSPVSFREPTMTARMAAAVDDLSQGRLILGLGAGWQEREHHNFGHDLLDVPERMDRFEEALQVITSLLTSDEPVDFEGDYYSLHDAILLPRPDRPGGPPILIGGNGRQRTLPLVAEYADEWNAAFTTPQHIQQLNQRLDELLEAQGRAPDEVRRSAAIAIRFGRNQAALEESLAGGRLSAGELRERGVIVGAGDEVIPQLEQFAQAGVQRALLQWLDLDDMDGLEALAHVVVPRFHGKQ